MHTHEWGKTEPKQNIAFTDTIQVGEKYSLPMPLLIPVSREGFYSLPNDIP